LEAVGSRSEGEPAFSVFQSGLRPGQTLSVALPLLRHSKWLCRVPLAHTLWRDNGGTRGAWDYPRMPNRSTPEPEAYQNAPPDVLDHGRAVRSEGAASPRVPGWARSKRQGPASERESPGAFVKRLQQASYKPLGQDSGSVTATQPGLLDVPARFFTLTELAELSPPVRRVRAR
jgi:hypothetical protein